MPQRVTAPYGDIYIAETPNIDKLGERLYAEQKYNEHQRMLNNRAMDDEFSKNLYKIRDADAEELTGLYSAWKKASNRVEMMGERASRQDQEDALRKQSEMYKLINESKDYKNWLELQAKQIASDKKGVYADDAHQQIIDRMKIPTRKTDRNTDGNLLYQYSVPDISKDILVAKGGKRKVELSLGKSKSDPLSNEYEVYEVGNTPNQYFNSLLQSVVAGNKGRNFSGYVLNQYDDKAVQDLKDKYYAKINDPKFVQVYGQTQPFPNYAFESPVGQAVMIKTMEDVVNTPLMGKTESRPNRTAIADRRINEAFAKMAQQNYYTMMHIEQMFRNSQKTPEAIRDITVGTIQSMKDSAGRNGGIVKVDKSLGTDITGGILSTEQFRVDENGNFQPQQKTTDAAGKETWVDKGNPITEQEVLNRLWERNKSIQTKGVELNADTPTRLPKDIKQTKMQPNAVKSYNKQDLLNAGWTEDQIKTATKAGKIKVN